MEVLTTGTLKDSVTLIQWRGVERDEGMSGRWEPSLRVEQGGVWRSGEGGKKGMRLNGRRIFVRRRPRRKQPNAVADQGSDGAGSLPCADEERPHPRTRYVRHWNRAGMTQLLADL